MVISVITLVIAITRILDIAMPDMVIRVLGMMELIALPVFAFAIRQTAVFLFYDKDSIAVEFL